MRGHPGDAAHAFGSGFDILFFSVAFVPNWVARSPAGHDSRAYYGHVATPIFFAYHAVTSGTVSIVTTTLAATSTVAAGAAAA